MRKENNDPRSIHQITPEEVVKLHGGDNKISLDTARRRIRRVRTELNLNRKFITIEEYTEFYKLPIDVVFCSIK